MSSAAAPAVSPGYSVRLARLGDERLAMRVAAGDVRAFAAIYERYHQPLFRYCRSILREDGDAHDALQSTFERAFAALQRSQRSAPLRPWLFRIAHNEAISLIRRRTADQATDQLEWGIAPSAEHAASERARLATLLDDLGDLPERPRGALIMRELGDLSHEEIAVALEISVGAAKQAIFEARRALSECVEGRAMACEEIQRKISDGDRRALRGRRIRAHLRDCTTCAGFAAAIPAREASLRALTPLLAPAAAAAIFARASGSAHGTGFGAGAAGGSGAGAGAGAALGKAGMASAALGSKLVAVAAIVAVGAGGAVGIAHLAARHGGAAPRLATHARGARTASVIVRPSTSAVVPPGTAAVGRARSATAIASPRARTAVKARNSHAGSRSQPTATRAVTSSASAPVAAPAPAIPGSRAVRGGGNSAAAHARSHGRSSGRSQHTSAGTTHRHPRVVPVVRVSPGQAGPKVTHQGQPQGPANVTRPAHKS